MKRKPNDISPILNRETGGSRGTGPPRRGEAEQINRRAFLRGAGTVPIGLPFLEGLPERSAWAADAAPVFSYFMVAACGVVGQVLPERTGALTRPGSQGDVRQGGERAGRARREPDVRQEHQFPSGWGEACGHAEGLCQSLTAVCRDRAAPRLTPGDPRRTW